MNSLRRRRGTSADAVPFEPERNELQNRRNNVSRAAAVPFEPERNALQNRRNNVSRADPVPFAPERNELGRRRGDAASASASASHSRADAFSRADADDAVPLEPERHELRRRRRSGASRVSPADATSAMPFSPARRSRTRTDAFSPTDATDPVDPIPLEPTSPSRAPPPIPFEGLDQRVDAHAAFRDTTITAVERRVFEGLVGLKVRAKTPRAKPGGKLPGGKSSGGEGKAPGGKGKTPGGGGKAPGCEQTPGGEGKAPGCEKTQTEKKTNTPRRPNPRIRIRPPIAPRPQPVMPAPLQALVAAQMARAARADASASASDAGATFAPDAGATATTDAVDAAAVDAADASADAAATAAHYQAFAQTPVSSITAAAAAELDEVGRLMSRAQTDVRVWEILHTRVLRRLGCGTPDAVLTASLPEHLTRTFSVLTTHFPGSPLALALVPTLARMGAAALAMGGSTRLFNLHLLGVWEGFRDGELVVGVLEMMDGWVFEFDEGTARVVARVARGVALAGPLAGRRVQREVAVWRRRVEERRQAGALRALRGGAEG